MGVSGRKIKTGTESVGEGGELVEQNGKQVQRGPDGGVVTRVEGQGQQKTLDGDELVDEEHVVEDGDHLNVKKV